MGRPHPGAAWGHFLKTEEVNELWRSGYNPLDYVRNDPELKAVMDLLMGGIGPGHG